MPVPIPPDAQWDLGEDNLARNTRKALEAAGITPAHADRMTTHQLSLVRGLGTARLERVGACLERMRNAPARAEAPNAGDVATHVQAFLDARPWVEPGEPAAGILAIPDPNPERGRWLNLTDDHLRALLTERKHLIASNNGLRYMAEQAQERAQAAGDTVHALLSTGAYQGPPIPQELADALNGPRTVMLAPAAAAVPAEAAAGDDDGQDDEDRPWTLAELTDHLRRQNPDADARVIREVSRRMAAQMTDVKQLDAGLVAHDLRHTLAALAIVAHELVSEWMSDLADDEKPHGVDGLADALNACAFAFAEIHGTF